MRHGRVALVTGAGSGIGSAVAAALYADGYRLVITGRRAERLEALACTLGADAASLLLAPGDVTDADSVRAIFAACLGAFGRLDLLFNNAGISAPAVPMEDLSLEQWQAVVDTNLTGPFLCTREAMRIMKHQQPRGGRIINNGSLSAHSPRPCSAPYTATKHAITGLTKATMLDGRAFDIVCGQIDIGNAATDMTLPMTQGVLQPDGSRQVEPRIDVAYVAQAVVQMAGLPLGANVPFMTIMASGMPFIGRG
jgi:NAD(P)-dependent dehydrogenase (short-subunit alcohol dehydrogenase family)